ncbi:MAG: polysaccharide biosynthesis/export family protein [Pseudorhodobacter sp.]
MSRFLVLMLGLFALAGAAFPERGQAQQDYRLRAGDTLRIEVLEDPSLNRPVLIAPDGRISFPLAGSMRASGRTVESVQADLAAALGPKFAAPPNVFVALERRAERSSRGGASAAMIEIYVMGEAANPGKLPIERGTTVLQAFAQMGGFTKFAAVKRVQLLRGQKRWLLNYKAIEAGSSNAGSTVLADGDVILVPQRRLFE